MRVRGVGDGIDLENLETTVKSAGYAQLSQRIVLMITALCAEIEGADTWEKCIRIQAELKALRRVLALPSILAEEMKK